MIPIVNGKQEWFAARGLYNGLVLLGDMTTGSYWDHITGESVHGELKGTQLEFSDYDLLYTTTEGALKILPHTQLAPSTRMPLQGKFMKTISPYVSKILGNKLPPHFVQTMAAEDTRRERMDMGVGLWTKTTQRYYPMDMIKSEPNSILDTVDAQTVFIYYNTSAQAPDAIYINANTVQADDRGFTFDIGDYLSDGKLCDSQGQAIITKRPQQMFTRWYGFAFTFPNCEIYAE